MDEKRKKSDGRQQYQKKRFFARFCALQVLYQLDCRNDWNLTDKDISHYLCLLSSAVEDVRDYLPDMLEAPCAKLFNIWKEQQEIEKQMEESEALLEKGRKSKEDYERYMALKKEDERRRKIRMRKAAKPEMEKKDTDEEEEDLSPVFFPEDEQPDPLLTDEAMAEISEKLKDFERKIPELDAEIDKQARQMVAKQPFVYALEIVRGVVAMSGQIDELISTAVNNWRLARMGMLDRNLIRLAAFELLNKPEPPAMPIPPATAINEAIELAKVFCKNDSTRFVNGVLDKMRMTIQATPPPADAETKSEG